MNYLNEAYINLDTIAKNHFEEYKNAKPFPHVVFDNFFNVDKLNDVLNEFPSNLDKIGLQFDSDPEKKLTSNNPDRLSKKINEFINFTNSHKFVNFINKISGIERHLIPDPYLWGGGVHELKNGGYLNVHADFNKHPKMNLDRRINVLIYLNHEWEEKFGGSLELWDNEIKKCVKKIVPIFNRMVIFNTTDFSFHGNPEPINCPDKTKTRKSIALYYYSNGRPKNETNVNPHTTLFKNRPNSNDSEKLTIYKKIFWKLYYQTKILIK